MKKIITFIILFLAFYQLGFSQCYTQISVGSYHTLAIKADGSLWACGSNSYGELGDGTKVDKNKFESIGNSKDWKFVEAGSTTSFGIKQDGTAWAWGNNANGLLGDGTKISKPLPTQIGTDQDWERIATYESHVLAVKKNGTLWAWGKNKYYQLGLNNTFDRTKPIQVGTENNWNLIAAGLDFSMATKKDGTLWTWGNDESGTLGLGLFEKAKVPTLADLSKYVSISAGDSHAVGVQADGTAWSWGYNGDKQLGLGYNVEKWTYYPTQIGNETSWKEIKAGFAFCIGLKQDGTVWSWGWNLFGQLGNPNNSLSPIPLKIVMLSGIKSIETGQDDTFAFETNGDIKVWGRNTGDHLGLGDLNSVKTPQKLNCTTVSLEESKTENLLTELFPNPATDFINIETSDIEVVEKISIYDNLGRTAVYIKQNPNLPVQIDISQYKSGLYFIQLNSKTNMRTLKFSKI